jgi:hypothetical protein
MSITTEEMRSSLNSQYSKLFEPDDTEELSCVYKSEYSPIGWIGLTPAPFLSSPTSEDSLSEDPDIRGTAVRNYAIKTAHRYQVSSVMQISVPNLSLSKDNRANYRFKLAKDFGYKIIIYAKFGSDEEVALRLDKHDQIFLFEKMTKAGIKESLERKMGRTTVSKNWYVTMPAKKYFYKQQWSYSFFPSSAFPIWKLSKPSDVYHQYKMCLLIEKQINMQKFNDDKLIWEDCEVDMSLFDNAPQLFAEPVLYGLFSDNSPLEQDRRQSEVNNSFYVLDMVNCDSSKKRSKGEKASANLKICPGVIQSLFWALENVSHLNLNITCNYTKDLHENKNSETPISLNTILTNYGAKFESLPSALLEDCLAPNTFNNASKQGILCWSYVEKVCEGNNGGSRPQNMGLKISCVISPDVPTNDIFLLRFRALTLKEISIINGSLVVCKL